MKISLRKRKKDETEEKDDATTLSVVKSLMDEEVCLTEQRDELLNLREGLQREAKEKIFIVTSSIEKLKNEVSELRLQCEQLKDFISNSK